jgi:hypothetical protein
VRGFKHGTRVEFTVGPRIGQRGTVERWMQEERLIYYVRVDGERGEWTYPCGSLRELSVLEQLAEAAQ